MKQDEPEYKIINGKPHLGVWLGSSMLIDDQVVGEITTEKMSYISQKLIADTNERFSSDHFQIRHLSQIYRPSFGFQKATIAIKFLVWGRAYKVKEYFKKGLPKYKKCIINGKRKLRRYA